MVNSLLLNLEKMTVSSASVIMTTDNTDEVANFSELNPTLEDSEFI